MIDPIGLSTAPALSPDSGQDVKDQTLRAASKEFEAVFLAEMLSHTSLGDTSKAFGGGAGEDAFASFLTREWADQLTERGGIGLSARIYQALATRYDGNV